MNGHNKLRRPRVALGLVGLLLFSLVGCGDDEADLKAPPPAGPDAPNAPALLTEPESAGELLFHAERSPKSYGPLQLKGRYTVRFAQYAPENPDVDFSTQSVFVVNLLKVSGKGPQTRPLFRDAAESGQTEVDLDGRYVIEVSFGDFPYALRFTPDDGT